MDIIDDTMPFRPKRVWQDEGLCAYVEPEIKKLFQNFPEGRPLKEDTRKKICRECPVIMECLSYAIVHDEYGVWGGTSKGERKKVSQKIKKALKEKAQKEGWYRPLRDFLPSVEYAPRTPPQEKTESLDDLDCPLDAQAQKPPQAPQPVPYFPVEVPAFVV